MFRKILIANRGEIAVRILRACREMGIGAAVVYSEADRAALHVQLADEAWPIGPAASRESYLSIERILGAARRAHADALHPGYGFLAENPALARACAEAGLAFIGPTPEAMERLGSKTAARQAAAEAGVATVPGTLGAIETPHRAREAGEQVGYPLLLKAVAGGGGKGMRVVESEAELMGGWRDASSEAMNAFGDPRVYIEKYLERPRHIEIQLLGDEQGNVVYLGERECSIQRRHQKVIEEAPSPVVDARLRQAMGEAAVRLARAAGYRNAGTAEFLVDGAGRFYFLEVNARLQVEHPVTEAVTALDLVKLQIRIAAGEPLPFRQADVKLQGHAMECRIYAEDPENHFFPSPGKILALRLPEGRGIRNDVGISSGWTVPGDYDPMLGKLIAWGADRAETLALLSRALREYAVAGIKTNLGLFRRLVREPEFVRGEFHTRWLDQWLSRPAADTAPQAPKPELDAPETAAALAAVLWEASRNGDGPTAAAAEPVSRWRIEGRAELLDCRPRR
ncbi:MAG TPA: acetyl-CoA carboxylase biotin carboxylase subunit [Candidatus Acidoferrales bacterium]|nr:acetyl-CoA carboxylase biotin carboxylase subunit [Candidatus Acidoferrales bacterium]